mmetsp:Transcript_29323/g.73668  ORF Transcript_29323/g.73668 Transcript_29323/m.73668 type:complete len:363 (-) Transcript_29323:1601-2689(-)
MRELAGGPVAAALGRVEEEACLAAGGRADRAGGRRRPARPPRPGGALRLHLPPANAGPKPPNLALPLLPPSCEVTVPAAAPVDARTRPAVPATGPRAGGRAAAALALALLPPGRQVPAASALAARAVPPARARRVPAAVAALVPPASPAGGRGATVRPVAQRAPGGIPPRRRLLRHCGRRPQGCAPAVVGKPRRRRLALVRRRSVRRRVGPLPAWLSRRGLAGRRRGRRRAAGHGLQLRQECGVHLGHELQHRGRAGAGRGAGRQRLQGLRGGRLRGRRGLLDRPGDARHGLLQRLALLLGQQHRLLGAVLLGQAARVERRHQARLAPQLLRRLQAVLPAPRRGVLRPQQQRGRRLPRHAWR